MEDLMIDLLHTLLESIFCMTALTVLKNLNGDRHDRLQTEIFKMFHGLNTIGKNHVYVQMVRHFACVGNRDMCDMLMKEVEEKSTKEVLALCKVELFKSNVLIPFDDVFYHLRRIKPLSHRYLILKETVEAVLGNEVKV